jgi:hypothetical protein
LLDPSVRHVNVPILEHDRALRPEEVLNPETCLGKKLEMATEFRRARVEPCVQDSGTHVQEGHYPLVRFAVKSEQKGVAQQMSTRVDGVAKNPFVEDLEAPHGTTLEIANGQANLWLGDQEVDVRDIPRNSVLDSVADLETENPMAAIGPEGGRRTRAGPGHGLGPAVLRLRNISRNG